MTVTLRGDKGSALTYAEMDGNFQHLVPTGAVFWFAASSAPSGYLTLDGSEVSQTTYADLFAVCGTTFNDGNEAAGNFRLPNLLNRHIQGYDSGSGRAFGSAEAGGASVEVTVPTTDWGTAGGAPGTLTSGRLVVGSGQNEINEVLESIRNASADRTFTGSVSDVKVPNVVLLPCIKF